MAYLLDTYNIVHAGIALGGAVSGLNVRKLCQWIAAFPQPLKVTLVLDGRPKPDEPDHNEFHHIEFVYSGAGISADKVIGQILERSGNRKKITVVTNDRAVALHARQLYAQAMSSEAFLKMLVGADRARTLKAQLPQKKTAGSIGEAETAHWLNEFGLKDPAAAPKPPPPEGELDDEEIQRLMGGGQ
jgi:predicted RNA-binding protein with PIN domain